MYFFCIFNFFLPLFFRLRDRQTQNNCLNQNSQNLQDYQNKVKDEFTYKIIGCAMKVHGMLGNGFQEVIYQRSLAIELELAGFDFITEILRLELAEPIL